MGECKFWYFCHGWDRWHCECGAELCTAHYLVHLKQMCPDHLQTHIAIDKQEILKNLNIDRIEEQNANIDRQIERNNRLKPFEARK